MDNTIDDNGQFERGMPLEVQRKNENIDTIIASTEAPIQEYFGRQILVHKENTCDLDYIKRVGSFLFNHDQAKIIGPIHGLNIDSKEGNLKIDVGYDPTEEGKLRKIQIDNKSLRGISLRGKVRTYKILERGESYDLAKGKAKYDPNMPTYIAIDWFPIHVSALADPADAKAGFVKRSLNNLIGVKIIGNKEFKKMDEQQMKDILEKIDGMINRRFEEIVPKFTEEINRKIESMGEKKNEPLKLAMTQEIMRDLCTRASAISEKAMNEVTMMALEGKGEVDILRHISTLLGSRTDAKDAGGNSLDKNGLERTINNTFKTVTDDDFYRSILSPTLVS